MHHDIQAAYRAIFDSPNGTLDPRRVSQGGHLPDKIADDPQVVRGFLKRSEKSGIVRKFRQLFDIGRTKLQGRNMPLLDCLEIATNRLFDSSIELIEGVNAKAISASDFDGFRDQVGEATRATAIGMGLALTSQAVSAVNGIASSGSASPELIGEKLAAVSFDGASRFATMALDATAASAMPVYDKALADVKSHDIDVRHQILKLEKAKGDGTKGLDEQIVNLKRFEYIPE
jgi:hypothetical protein